MYRERDRFNMCICLSMQLLLVLFKSVFLLSLQKQPKTTPNLFRRGVEYGKRCDRDAVRHRAPELQAEEDLGAPRSDVPLA